MKKPTKLTENKNKKPDKTYQIHQPTDHPSVHT